MKKSKSVSLHGSVLGIFLCLFLTIFTGVSISLLSSQGYEKASLETSINKDQSVYASGDNSPLSNRTKYDFYQNKKIVQANIHENVRVITQNAYSDCPNLTCVKIPKNVAIIEENAFNDCPELKTIVIYSSELFVNESAFQHINQEAFFYVRSEKIKNSLLSCKNINSEQIIIFNGDYFNYEGNVITSLTQKGQNSIRLIIPEGIKEIADNCFIDCDTLKAIKLPKSLEKIGKNAFDGCHQLEAITIPENITLIDEEAFSGCSNLKKIALQSMKTKIERRAFNNINGSALFYVNSIFVQYFLLNSLCGIDKDQIIITSNDCYIFDETKIIGLSEKGKKQTNLVIPENVTAIEDQAFSNNEHLEKIIISDSVSYLGKQVFEFCPNLRYVELRNSEINFTKQSLLNINDDVKFVVANNTIRKKLLRLRIPAYQISLENIPKVICHYLDEELGERIEIKEYVNSTKIKKDDFSGNNALKFVEITEGIEIIDQNAFTRCKNLMQVKFPQSITQINSGAFRECSNLIRVKLPEEITVIAKETFLYCSNLLEIYFPANITKIDENAFGFCSALREIKIEDGSKLKIIGKNAFQNCPKMENFNLPPKLEFIDEQAFLNTNSHFFVPTQEIGLQLEEGSQVDSDAIFSENREAFFLIDKRNDEIIGLNALGKRAKNLVIDNSISKNALCNNHVLKNVGITKNVTSIGDGAFKNCPNLERVVFEPGSKIKEINQETFRNCPKLRFINLPNSITRIGPDAFRDCKGLTFFILPNDLHTIDAYVFTDCINLKYVQAGPKLLVIGIYSFGKCSNLERFNIPYSIQKIDKWAFFGCKNLVEIVIPNATVIIEGGAFEGCGGNIYVLTEAQKYTIRIQAGATRLSYTGDFTIKSGDNHVLLEKNENYADKTRIIIPKNVTYIDQDAFKDLKDIKSIVFPEKLQVVGVSAFNGCANLKEIKLPPEVWLIDKYAFANCTNLEKVVINSKNITCELGAFSNCPNLTTVVINSQEIKMGENIFGNNPFLVYHVFHDTVRERLMEFGVNRDQIIQGKSICFEYDQRKIIGLTLFGKTQLKIEIPEGIKIIGERAFADNKNLIAMEIGQSVSMIEDNAFENCDKLKSVAILNPTTSMGKGVFNNCPNLDKLVYCSRIIFDWLVQKYWQENKILAFYPEYDGYWLRCLDLSSWKNDDGKAYVDINPNIIDHENFPIQKIVLPRAMVAMNLHIWCKTYIIGMIDYAGENKLPYNTKWKSLEPNYGYNPNDPTDHECDFPYITFILHDKVTFDRMKRLRTNPKKTLYDPNYHFEFDNKRSIVRGTDLAKKATKIVIPKNIEWISENAFANFDKLESVELTNEVVCIAKRAFYGCKNLKSISLNDFVTGIQKEAFANCESLKEIKILNWVDDMKIDENAFYGIHEDAKIYVKNETIKSKVLASSPNIKENQIEIVENLS